MTCMDFGTLRAASRMHVASEGVSVCGGGQTRWYVCRISRDTVRLGIEVKLELKMEIPMSVLPVSTPSHLRSTHSYRVLTLNTTVDRQNG